MNEILSSIVRFAYQPQVEVPRMVATNYPWNAIVWVLVITGVINIIDPMLYTGEMSFWAETAFNVVFVGPVTVVAVTFIYAYLTRWLFSLSNITTTLKDNVVINAWTGALYAVLYTPLIVLVVADIPGVEAIVTLGMGALIVYTLVLSVVAYRTLTRASWFHVVGVFMAVGIIVFAGAAALAFALGTLGILPAGLWTE